jgi:hypothetical protein
MTWPVPPLEPGSAVTSTLRTSGARSSRRCPDGTLRRGPFSAQHIPTNDDAVIKRRDRKHRAIPAPQAERPAEHVVTAHRRLRSSRSRIGLRDDQNGQGVAVRCSADRSAFGTGGPSTRHDRMSAEPRPP